jgi:uncharacterized protein with HEPN domain
MNLARRYVDDIVQTMETVGAFVSGTDRRAYAADLKTQYAVAYGFMIMGEAAKRAPDDTRARCPEVMWREMAGMRDVIVHQYAHVVPDVAWRAIHERFPIERPALRRLLADLDAEAGDG